MHKNIVCLYDINLILRGFTRWLPCTETVLVRGVFGRYFLLTERWIGVHLFNANEAMRLKHLRPCFYFSGLTWLYYGNVWIFIFCLIKFWPVSRSPFCNRIRSGVSISIFGGAEFYLFYWENVFWSIKIFLKQQTIRSLSVFILMLTVNFTSKNIFWLLKNIIKYDCILEACRIYFSLPNGWLLFNSKGRYFENLVYKHDVSDGE